MSHLINLIFSYIASKIITIWVQIRDLYLYLFRNAIIINAYVDDHTWIGIRHRNWGDDLNFYFIQMISKRPVIIYRNFKLAHWLHLRNFLCIGTLLDGEDYKNSETIIWGSGCSGADRDLSHPYQVNAVRGPLSIRYLKQHSIKCPEVFGDPALLLPLFISTKKNKKYKLGIIPHVIDLKHNIICKIKKQNPDILIIDLANYENWTDIISEICSCEFIASSSLHGLIVSDAYGIPNCWIEISGKLSGGYFKFYDYASSVGRELSIPYKLASTQDIPHLFHLCKINTEIKINMEKLMAACPFKIYKQIKYI